MASVAFKFKSDHQFESIDITNGRGSLTVAELRQVVTDRRLAGSSTSFGLRIANADTGQGAPLATRIVHATRLPGPTPLTTRARVRLCTEFLDDNAAVAAGTSVLIRRVPLSLATGGCSCSDNLCARPLRSPFRVVPSQRLVLGGQIKLVRVPTPPVVLPRLLPSSLTGAAAASSLCSLHAVMPMALAHLASAGARCTHSLTCAPDACACLVCSALARPLLPPRRLPAR